MIPITAIPITMIPIIGISITVIPITVIPITVIPIIVIHITVIPIIVIHITLISIILIPIISEPYNLWTYNFLTISPNSLSILEVPNVNVFLQLVNERVGAASSGRRSGRRPLYTLLY